MEKLLNDYFDLINRSLLPPQSGALKDEHQSIMDQARSYSLFVRGEAYPQQLLEAAESLYSNYDDWFQRCLGFRISNAITIFKCMQTELNRRLNDEKCRAVEGAEQDVKHLTEAGSVSAQEREAAKMKIAWTRFYGRSDELLSFTPQQISDLSSCPLDACLAFLKRMSQEFGYVNPHFPGAFEDAQGAPWDYRSLYERPIVARDGRYFVLTLFLFPEAIFRTFYYDLIADTNYWNNGGQDIYGRWLESTTADYLKRVFPEDEVLLDPYYSPDGKEQRELCDVLVLHDRKVLIVQCKAKKMRFESLMGASYDTIREDLSKSVGDSFRQAVTAYNYLKDCFDTKRKLSLTVSGETLVVDVAQVADLSSDVFLVSVVLEHYQNFITRLANTNESLGLFPAGSYPWAVSLADLDVVTDLLESPAVFLHYAKRRTLVERTPFVVLGDELDMLGFYFTQGLYFDADDFKDIGFLGLTGQSEAIDQYMFEKYTATGEPTKPTQYAPDGFWDYIRDVEGMDSSYSVDCAMFLLDLDWQSRESFVGAVSAAKARARRDGRIHSYRGALSEQTGWCFIAMDAGQNQEILFKQLMGFMLIKKYETKSRTYFGYGWDVHSGNLLDLALFVSGEWYEDAVMARIVDESPKAGKPIDT